MVGDQEVEPPAANSAATGLEASLTGNGPIDEAILTSGGCCRAAPATFAKEIEDDELPMFHIGTHKDGSPRMFNICTERQSSSGSCGMGSGWSFDFPRMANIATDKTPQRRLSPRALVETQDFGLVAGQRVREDLGAPGAVSSALLYEMPWSDKVA